MSILPDSGWINAPPILLIVAVFSSTLSLTSVAQDQIANNPEQSLLLQRRNIQSEGERGREKAQKATIERIDHSPSREIRHLIDCPRNGCQPFYTYVHGSPVTTPMGKKLVYTPGGIHNIDHPFSIDDLIWKSPLDRKDDFLEKKERHKRKEAKLNSPSTLAPADELPMAWDVIETELVGQLTGADSLNHTAARWDIYGTDLGHMFWHRDKLYMVFGDTFGEGGLGGKHWRSNALARLADPDPRQGLRIEAMITGPDRTAKELIPSRKIAGIEKTVIPTHGISVDGRMYLHYMSVRRWGEHSGQWDVRHSGFAYSDDDGQTWHTPRSAIWPRDTGFEQVALVHGEDGYVYTLGIPGGRWGGVRLRRVVPHGILNQRAYEYWNGAGWITDPKAAAIIVPAPVGELSVAWSARHRRWLMMYLNLERHAVVLRTAPELTGPWGEEQIVVTAEQYPGLYAPYIVPVSDLGNDVYFTLSMWGPYNVFLMHTRLQGGSDSLHARNESSP